VTGAGKPAAATATPRIWLFVSIAWVIPGILAVVQSYGQSRLDGRPAPPWPELLWQGVDWLLYGALTPAVFFLGRRLPLRPGRLVRHIPLHLLAAAALGLLWAVGGAFLRWALLGDSDWITLNGLLSWALTTLPFGTTVYFAMLGIEHGVHYWVEAREREARLAEARLDALRMQIQPHFLLNSLNAITVLVRDRDTGTATRLLEQLGEVLRRVLRSDRGQLVPLSDEIEFVERYLEIERVRFPDRLRPAVRVDPAAAQAAVPDFILQPLVENAIRHGVARRTEAGYLAVTARREGDDLVLTVEDDGVGPQEERAGVGLSNTRERLAALYGERGGLELGPREGGGARATIRLPFSVFRA